MKTSILLSIFFLSLQTFAQSGLIAKYSFNNGHTNDESGNGYDLTNNGAVLTTDRFGNAYAACKFDGTDDYLSREAFDVSEESVISISLWLYSEGIQSENEFTGLCFGSRQYGMLSIRQKKDGERIFQVLLGDADLVNYSAMNSETFEYQKWYHLVAIVKDLDVKLYVNGVLQTDNKSQGSGGKISSCVSATTKLRIGEFIGYGGSKTYFNGMIDDIFIYNKELSESEINSLYNAPDFAGIDENNESLNQINVYPNPVKTSFVVTSKLNKIKSVIILNSLGQQVDEIAINNQYETIDVSSLNKGLYHINILFSNGNVVHRIIIKE